MFRVASCLLRQHQLLGQDGLLGRETGVLRQCQLREFNRLRWPDERQPKSDI
jgi:hypothetical protein